MPNYQRAFVPGGTFFFTVVTLERRRGLLTKHISNLRQAFVQTKVSQPFTIDAIVILPDHLHCIWTLPAGDSDFSSRWHAIKSHFSKGLPKSEWLSKRRQAKGERGIWQRRFWEHVIRNQNDMNRHLDYIHFNPVKHGHVLNVGDWPYSSFHMYVEKGCYDGDWGAEPEIMELDFE
jgi:putative transposase